jgi:hypothetical protein
MRKNKCHLGYLLSIFEQKSVLRIPDVYPGSEFFYPGPRVKKIPDLDPHQRIFVFLTQKIVSKLSEKSSGMLISDPDFSHSGSCIRIHNTERN